MKPAKLAPVFLVVGLALASLACPTRPIDTSGTGGAAGAATAGTGGAGGSGAAGNGGAAGSAAGNGGAVGGHAGGVAGSAGGAAGNGAAGGAGGMAGAPGGTAGGTASAGGGTAGAAGGPVGAGGGEAGSAGARDGQPCSIAADCASAVCTGFYVDVDGDGYGAGQPSGFCGTIPPIGYASMNGDCCDNATNIAVAKLIHPGADFQTTSAGGVCGITWDYDCSGTVESNPQTSACSGSYPACPSIDANYAESSCGTPDDKGCNCSSMSGSCMLFCVGHPVGENIACK